MDWDVDTTGLIITSGTCCGQEAQSVNDTVRWQIWHSKFLVDGGPDLRRSRLASNSYLLTYLLTNGISNHKPNNFTLIP